MSSHFGMPGPGGSMGQCAVCGDSFIGDVVKGMMGVDSHIESFKVGFLEQMLYCHAPKCKETLSTAFAAESDGGPEAVYDALPDGPLKKVLREAIDQQEIVE
jgi:hypothetical protein